MEAGATPVGGEMGVPRYYGYALRLRFSIPNEKNIEGTPSIQFPRKSLSKGVVEYHESFYTKQSGVIERGLEQCLFLENFSYPRDVGSENEHSA